MTDAPKARDKDSPEAAPTGPAPLRRGWTTGACATAALKAALHMLWGGQAPGQVTISLPRGGTARFEIAETRQGEGWAEAGVIKDAGDDPDVTHGALIRARVREAGEGLSFCAGEGVGTVTKPGLPVPVGEPAINPVPRAMMRRAALEAALETGRLSPQARPEAEADAGPWPLPGLEVTISVPGGEALAERTWNPRLGIRGGLSILGTTGIVRPFSCSAWIASIHRGIDVARACGLEHVAGATGATSEAAVQRLYGLEDSALIDMGDFVGGMVKYLRRHPVPRLTVAGGPGKLTKLAQGATDLHSKRSQVDMAELARWLGDPAVQDMNTVLEVFEKHGVRMAGTIAEKALEQLRNMLAGAPVRADVVVVDRAGQIVGRAGP